MKLKCARCEREGRPAHVAEVEPLENLSETHGLCAEHHREWLKSLGLSDRKAPPAPDRSSPPPPPA
jgi:hypothetical protein